MLDPPNITLTWDSSKNIKCVIVLVHERDEDSQSYIIEKGPSGSLSTCDPPSGNNTPDKYSLNKWECSW